jgi:diguanylate cyclase (GGDEF)-like protein/PAS domain S-box-containing protein
MSRRPGSRILEDSGSLREFVRNLREAIYITNREGQILDGNPALLRMFGVSSLDELRKYKAGDLFADPETRKKQLQILDQHGAFREFELQIRTAQGEVRTVLDTAYAVHDEQTGERLHHGILIDITERKQLEQQLLEQSRHDPLTGCYNRRYLDEFEAMMSRSLQTWGCILIDIDHFKQYNDQYGHQAGDRVLVKMARFLMRQIRAEEGVVRMGGDEFLVCLGGADKAGTHVVVKRVQRAALNQAPVPFTLGWSSREADEKLERTIARADENLLKVRVQQRNFSRRKGK